MKTKLFFLSLALFGSLQIYAQITLSHNVDPITVDVKGLACGVPNGESWDNYFARVYNLNDFGITGDFLISEVEFGADDDGDVGKIVFVNIYTSDSENLTTATLTLVSTTEILLQGSDLTLISVPIEDVTIPAGSIVMVETFAPADPARHYHPSFNLAGHSGTAWAKVPECGQPVWVDANDSGVGDEQHILINLVGTEILGVSDSTLENVMLYPNPTVGSFKIDLANSYDVVDITITNFIGQRVSSSKFSNVSMLELSIDGDKGIYFVTINTSNGKSKTLKIIKI